MILYELLTGSLPFYAQRIPELCVKIATQQQPPLRSRRPDVPEAIEAVVQRCLEKDRSRRYPNVVALALALAEFAPKRARASVVRIMRTMQAAGLSTTGPTIPILSDRPAPVPVISVRARSSPSIPDSTLPVLSDRPSYHTASRSINPLLQKTIPAKSRTRQVAAMGSLGAVALMVALGTGFVARRSASSAQGHAGPIPSPPPALELQAPELGAAPAPSSLPSSESPDRALAFQADAPDGGSGKPRPHKTTNLPAAAAKRAKGHNAIANPECAAPYSVDSDGVKRFRPECL